MPLADTMPSATARGSEPGATRDGDRPDGVARPHDDGAGVPEGGVRLERVPQGPQHDRQNNGGGGRQGGPAPANTCSAHADMVPERLFGVNTRIEHMFATPRARC